jgi:hypothetical protein
VRFEVRGGRSAEELADLLAGSPRFDVSDWGLTIRVEPARACMIDVSGAVIACTDARPPSGNASEVSASVARAFHEIVFAPRIDLSQTDANSLDGSNRVSRDPLRTMFGHEPPPRD